MASDKKALDPVNVTVGKRLRYRREKEGLSQDALGGMVSVSRIKIGQFEAGTSSIPAATLYKLSRIFDVSVGYFYEELAGPSNDSENNFDPLSNKEAINLLKSYEELEDENVRSELANLIKETAAFYNKKKK